MSMLQYPLYDFLATVPNCVETSTLAIVLGIFEQEQCDRLVIVNQQQCPLGLVQSARLTQKLLVASSGHEMLDWHQPLSKWDQSIIEPLKTLPASYCVEQLELLLRYQLEFSGSEHQILRNNNLEWALIDADGKFLGLLNSASLLRALAKEKLAINTRKNRYSPAVKRTAKNISPDNLNTSRKRAKTHRQIDLLGMGRCPSNSTGESQRTNQRQPAQKSLVQLLELLPWPLMLQTGTGEVVAKNPAWWQQLGALKDPEAIRQQVEAILASAQTKTATEYASQQGSRFYSHGEGGNARQGQSIPLRSKLGLPPRISSPPPMDNVYKQPIATTATSNRCFLDSQMGTCTCVVEVQSGQERIWQFAKISLDNQKSELLLREILAGEFTFEQTGENLKTEQNHDLWLVLATDVTEQQQICKELAAKNADLIQLNRLKDEFLACISHELKTPLTAVLGLSRLLVDQQLGTLNERQARYAGLIHQSGRHLMSVVNDILDLTRMETGQMDLALVPVKIRTVCDRALAEAKAIHTQTTKASASANPTENAIPDFTLFVEPGLDQMVADELRLRQMLVHLLSNAFKFTENSGEIGLRVSRWEGWVAFTVWDTGIGIPEHQQHLIFQKFQQLENPLTRQFEGTGLGLVLTRALARLHGGDVSFLSREGKGSQFTLLLPPSPPPTGLTSTDMGMRADGKIPVSETREVTSSARSPMATIAQHQPTSSQRLVLVVEAVAGYIEDLTDQLKGLGYRVVIARSGTEAVEKARRLQPKAIFLNPLLPLLSGWDVLTLLKSDAATRHIPVMVTATGAEKDQAFAYGSDGFLNLPVKHQDLVPLLENLVTQLAIGHSGLENQHITVTRTPLRILRLVEHNLQSIDPHPSLREHRVIEVDDLDQAELLARVWKFDVILLDAKGSVAQTYLEQLIQHPTLANIPLVTCDVATTLAASQISGLSVFPYLTSLSREEKNLTQQTDPLLSVLQIASGVCCPPSILVVDLTMLDDLPRTRFKKVKDATVKQSSLNNEITERGSEWFQALIQYLQTAGLKAAMGRCWTEVLQQIRHQSVDLLLICLGDSSVDQEVLGKLKVLADLPEDLPPILVIDEKLNHTVTCSLSEGSPVENVMSELAQFVLSIGSRQALGKSRPLPGSVSVRKTEETNAQILPRSISMEDLLTQINQALGVRRPGEFS
ncbi:ATP-binding response regulator [Umezakia ovalisporum]|uniref:histidine kinase n=2 Tax=Umezakia ovalisporum TaxID=75695 RepID=A0AA43KFR1_9CYAN|nr:hybrid sensor histidine kinase/response regulator [Umezakia ovalisporum]MDH6057779.1 hybrid sensor histidine kinase/response regulator [Umezakia ovalisporum FSS-43]MDH6064811.1 hybrid sensor histidine kinase/response regulator [Umezakia ovalisporum FSS-62]MDH6067411.1 hybrid sensor histidine kinase/response regulator [Umezakia ovalisporum APH033B]MDH6070366.1 hybrid sensor histidine kinase/response regulator [Umezakia ovalisporum CobakiLakeA]MDH6074616.1 hybrid sensor histidine kinase/respo